MEKEGDISHYINSYMNNLEKAELTASAHNTERISKSGIPINNSKLSDTACKSEKKKEKKSTGN